MVDRLQLTPLVTEFCANVDAISTRGVYGRRLHNFDGFLNQKYNIDIDNFVQSFKGNPQFEVYKVIAEYKQSLIDKIQTNTIRGRLMTIRNFLEYFDVQITATKWRLKVKPPKPEETDKYDLDVSTVRKVIIGCRNMRLKAYVHTLASTGCRPTELLAVRTKDVDLDEGSIYLQSKSTKMRKSRTVKLTKENIGVLKQWLEYRGRVRTTRPNNGKIVYKTVELNPNDLFFSTGVHDEDGHFSNKPYHFYKTVNTAFIKMLKEIKLNDTRDSDNRHKITLHSFRSFVKTTISNLGYQDYSEYYIGHKHSTYWTKSKEKIQEMFNIVEPYFTFLDYNKLEAHGQDTETKLADSYKLIEELRLGLLQQKEEFELFKKNFMERLGVSS